ncbi:MAG: DUF456 family protein [Gemmatimonadaceae bacterium]|jgi:hypothetical protein
MQIALLVLVLVAGLIMLPLGLPGLWVMAGAVLLDAAVVPSHVVSLKLGIAVTVVAGLAELVELALAGRFARRYGGSRRAGWGAIIGSLVGAFVGVPVPIIGSMVGAFVGAFAGAFLAEVSRRTEVVGAARVATGAMLGRIAATAMKVGVGCAVLAWVVLSIVLRTS